MLHFDELMFEFSLVNGSREIVKVFLVAFIIKIKRNIEESINSMIKKITKKKNLYTFRVKYIIDIIILKKNIY